MSQFYLNRPSVGRAISAEEFAGEAGTSFSDCTGTSQGADCCCGGDNTSVQPAPPANCCCCCCCESCTPVRPTPPVSGGNNSDCCCCCEPCTPVRPTPPVNGGNNGDCCCCCCEPCTPVRPTPPVSGGSNSDCCCCCEPCTPVRPEPPVNGGSGCGCDCDCCCCCCCRHAHTPPPQVNEGCCCKQSFRAALGLLCDQQISSLLDFDMAAFITNTYTAGTTLTGGKPYAGAVPVQAGGDAGGTMGKPNTPPHCSPSGASDNLGTLSGSFRRFSPCTCDLLDIDAELYTAGRKGCVFTAAQVSLCELDAVVIQAAKACSEGELSADTVMDRNFRCLSARLAQRLNPCGDPCGQNWCSCACDSRDCCCAAGMLATLAQNNLSRRVSLAAGLLVLNGVTLLGTVGNVLVLANDADHRLYFVCVNSVQFIG